MKDNLKTTNQIIYKKLQDYLNNLDTIFQKEKELTTKLEQLYKQQIDNLK